jgi:hypothetical protein
MQHHDPALSGQKEKQAAILKAINMDDGRSPSDSLRVDQFQEHKPKKKQKHKKSSKNEGGKMSKKNSKKSKYEGTGYRPTITS